MRHLSLLILFASVTALGQQKRSINSISQCDSLIRQGYTQQFCDYNLQYQFKGIPFESKFELVDSLMNLKRDEHYSDIYNIYNAKYIDWGVTKFTRGYVQFNNHKFLGITLDLMDDKGIPEYKFETIIKYLSDLFGNPKIVKTSNKNITLYEWLGNKLKIDANFFNPTGNDGMITVSIFSNNLAVPGLDNL